MAPTRDRTSARYTPRLCYERLPLPRFRTNMDELARGPSQMWSCSAFMNDFSMTAESFEIVAASLSNLEMGHAETYKLLGVCTGWKVTSTVTLERR